jgi:pSer/pThr/pTyr-binding forkhead associated (FHA) protein
MIEDLNSTNGIYLNGVRVTRAELHEGDELMVGKTSLRFQVRQMLASATPPVQSFPNARD